jgi:hypothetical protein
MSTYCTGPDGQAMDCEDAYRAHLVQGRTVQAKGNRDCEKYGINCPDEFEWSEVGEGVLDFFTAFTKGWLAPTSEPRGPNINIAARERKTGFDLQRQWPWLALGGLGVVLLSRRR